jgi:hypothetical protein
MSDDKSSDSPVASTGAASPGPKLRVKNLKLSKEALRTLSGTEMRTVAGGLRVTGTATFVDCPSTPCITQLVCPTDICFAK